MKKIKLFRKLFQILLTNEAVRKWLDEPKEDLLLKSPNDVGVNRTINLLEISQHIIA